MCINDLRKPGLIVLLFFAILAISCTNDSASGEKESQPEQKETPQMQVNPDHGHDHAQENSEKDLKGKEVEYERNSKAKQQRQMEEAKGTVSPEEWSKKKQEIERSDIQPDPSQIGHPVTKTNLPSACGLITAEKLGKILKVDSKQITLKDGSGRHSPHSQSCFFRWSHEGVPNSGILIQVQDNPVADEFPEWASYYVSAKINQGDQMPDGSGSFRYKRMDDGLGSVAAYSYDLGRYIWRLNNDYVFMVAFNLPGTGEQKIEWAEAIGKEVMKNF